MSVTASTPSQRRVLVSMHDLNLGPRSKHRKCAKIAGDTSGNYHPHGEAVIYPTLVRMAQPFNMRYRLVDGQGNFGSVDGDPPAAMRYTEARMTAMASAMMDDIDLDTVDFIPNYEGTRTEPTVLPSRFPNLLVNGHERDCCRYGDQHPSAFTARSVSGSPAPHRQPRGDGRRFDGIRQRTGFSDRRHLVWKLRRRRRPTRPVAAK